MLHRNAAHRLLLAPRIKSNSIVATSRHFFASAAWPFLERTTSNRFRRLVLRCSPQSAAHSLPMYLLRQDLDDAAKPEFLPHSASSSMAGVWTMKRLLGLIGALSLVIAFGAMSRPAEARDIGLHISGPGYHFDFGRPHHRTSYYSGYGGGYGSYYDSCYGGYGGGWHDTSHYDYHPGEVVRHRNHYHYVPGHYDYHQDGHFDHGW
jgi:hypothetical protein